MAVARTDCSKATSEVTGMLLGPSHVGIPGPPLSHTVP